jgi:hypothetical protein
MLKQKSDAYDKIKEFVLTVERSHPKYKISKLRTDGGGEFISKRMSEFMKSLGITQETSAPYCQFQNGVAERSIGIIDDSSRAMLEHASLSSYDWPFAIVHAVYLRNNIISNSIQEGTTPEELFVGVKRTLEPKGVFGCLIYAKNFVRNKHDNKSVKCLFLGYSEQYKAYMIRSVGTYYASLREYYAKDVIFDVTQFPYKSILVPRPQVPPLDLEDEKEERKLQADRDNEVDSNEVVLVDVEPFDDLPELTADSSDDDSDDEDNDPVDVTNDDFDDNTDMLDEKHNDDSILELPDFPPHVVDRRNPVRGARGCSTKALEKVQSENFGLMLKDEDPKTREEAMNSPDWPQWQEAERQEIASMYERGVWELVPRTRGMNVLGNRMLHKKKREMGVVVKFKARLVAQGFRQRPGVDYNQTFASTVQMQSVRIFLWMVAHYNLEFYKIDIKTFFLYGDLEEELYMQQPEGYEDDSKPNHVCKLLKSIYGTKQAMRCANKHLKGSLQSIGMKQLLSDDYVFIKRVDDNFIILCNHVDDIACGSTSTSMIDSFVDKLKSIYTVTVEAEPKVYLALEIQRDRSRRWMKINQTSYIKDMAASFGITSSNSVPRPIPFARPEMPPPKDIVKDSTVPYQELVGSLLWCLKSRPDVSFCLSFLCRYMGSYNKALFSLAIKTLTYLYHTRHDGLVYECKGAVADPIKIEYFVDADWGADVGTSKSVTGWIAVFNGSPVYAGCKTQKRPALSSTEAECNGMEIGCREIEWTKGILNELAVKFALPIKMWQDNMGSIKLSVECLSPSRTKYYRISQAYVRWCTDIGLIKTEYLASDEHPCDVLNKFVSKIKLKKFLPAVLGPQDDAPPPDVAAVNLARWKQCSRREPRRIRMIGSEFASRSGTDPPLVCRCLCCRCWFPWIPRKQDWMSCHERRVNCDNHSEVSVTCFACKGPAQYNRRLGSYSCPSCSEFTPKRLRALPPRTRRYGQSSE